MTHLTPQDHTNSAAPNSAAPNSAAPNSAAPNSAAPNSAAPNSAAPNSAAVDPQVTESLRTLLTCMFESLAYIEGQLDRWIILTLSGTSDPAHLPTIHDQDTFRSLMARSGLNGEALSEWLRQVKREAQVDAWVELGWNLIEKARRDAGQWTLSALGGGEPESTEVIEHLGHVLKSLGRLMKPAEFVRPRRLSDVALLSIQGDPDERVPLKPRARRRQSREEQWMIRVILWLMGPRARAVAAAESGPLWYQSENGSHSLAQVLIRPPTPAEEKWISALRAMDAAGITALSEELDRAAPLVAESLASGQGFKNALVGRPTNQLLGGEESQHELRWNVIFAGLDHNELRNDPAQRAALESLRLSLTRPLRPAPPEREDDRRARRDYERAAARCGAPRPDRLLRAGRS